VMRSVLRSTTTRRALVWNPAEAGVLSGVTVAELVLEPGRTAQDASSGSAPLGTMRTRNRSSRSAVICSRSVALRISIPLGSGVTRASWAAEGKEKRVQETTLSGHELRILILERVNFPFNFCFRGLILVDHPRPAGWNLRAR
jgi:hypothetical protein